MTDEKRTDYEDREEGFLGYPLAYKQSPLRRSTFEPWYDDKKDYNTNAPSYYDYLGRMHKLIQLLAERIWEYDKELAKRFEEWDKLIEKFPENVEKLLIEWMEDGTLDEIINENIFNNLNNKIDAMRFAVDKNIQDIKDHEARMQTLEKRQSKTLKLLYQKRAMSFNLGSRDNELFQGAHRANQGITYIEHEGHEYVFLLHRDSGSGWDEDEKQRITQFEYTNDGLLADTIAISNVIRVGHQGISALIENNEIYLICGSYNQKGYTKVKWQGNETDQKDIQHYELLEPDSDSSPNSIFYNNTPATDKQGKYVVMSGSARYEGGLRYVLIYNRKEVENALTTKHVKPLNIFKIKAIGYTSSNIVQDITMDESHIYILHGAAGKRKPIILQTYSLSGEFLGYHTIDTMYNAYSQRDIVSGDVSIEPEGISLRGDHVLVEIVNVEKRDNGDISTKVLYECSAEPMPDSEPINSGVSPKEVPSNIHLQGNPNDISFNKGDALQISGYDFETEEFLNALSYNGSHTFSIYDSREGADNEQRMLLGGYYRDNEQYAVIRGDRSNDKGAGFNLSTNKGGQYGTITFIAPNDSGSDEKRAYFSGGTGNFRPGEDNKQSLGGGAHKWENVYSTNGIQSTSDQRLKKDIENSDLGIDFINDLRAVKYKNIDGKRNHYGIIAQELKEVLDQLDIDFGGFQDHNLDENEPLDTYTIGYGELIAPLIKAVQELSKQVEDLKKG